MHLVKIVRKDVEKIDLTNLSYYLSWDLDSKKYFLTNTGSEHYKLLAYLSNQIGGDIADIGTLRGASALALSLNENSNIFTFDILNQIPDEGDTPVTRKNIHMYLIRGQDVIPLIKHCKLIVMDVDPHDGKQEVEIFNKLVEHKFQGILIVDDIHLNDGMERFWNSIPTHLKKLDLTHLGHGTGTGLVVFDRNVIDVDIED
jgi:hypothetical protein